MANQPAQAPLNGRLVRSSVASRGGPVRQVGYLDDCQNGCAPGCDCFDSGPSCGMEASCGFEPGCGVEGCVTCGEATCGVESMLGGPVYQGGSACRMASYGQCGCDACCADSIPVFLPILRINWARFQFFAGVQGFKGPMNFANTDAANPNSRSGSGSFGFYEGLNEGRNLKPLLGLDISAQLGFRATQSNLSGTEFTGDSRNQFFLTGGFFRQVDYGLQYGVVFDYLNDDWWFQGNMTQLRGELSWKTNDCHTFGFQFMSGLDGDSSDGIVRNTAGNIVRTTVNFDPTDQYRFFYRRLLPGTGDWTAFAGWTDDSDGILGATLNLPLRQKLVLSTGATFLIPDDNSVAFDNRDEGWNISLGLVYRPGGPIGCGRYCRPMFDVADNGTFMVDQR
ncbi:DUF6666 family protein [Rubripirellula lacrimiformis]|uniref:DUF6666 family protein n=1 Tax=Rubripirellula lacrimiformis TaxID=1930273 RepID=UPI00119CF745|nr:DUF6666 family protein [Rubripirellula lacrimiformis]